MINFSIAISNPWSNCEFDVVYSTVKPLSTYKFLELEVFKHPVVLEVGMGINFRRDHASIGIELGLLGYTLSVSIVDSRHWDRANDTWEMAADERG